MFENSVREWYETVVCSTLVIEQDRLEWEEIAADPLKWSTKHMMSGQILICMVNKVLQMKEITT